MTVFRTLTQPASPVNEFVTEAFNGATIALVAVLGVMTWALAI